MDNEELLQRQLPHSVEAEQAVLGSMLIDPRCVPEVIDKLRVEDFYLRQNREIYETIYSMFNYSLTIDPVTVLENMKQNGYYDENQSRGYILQLMDATPTAANIKEYIDAPFIHAVGGSWVCPKADIAAGNFEKITQLCAEARKAALGE